MSSGDEDTIPLNKKRKLQRACDYCRHKKIKCDGPDMPNNRCSRCTARRIECTYKEAFSKSSYPSSYVEKLESRLERMEQLVNKLCPEGRVPKELEGSLSAGAELPETPHTSIASRAGSSRSEPLSSLSPSSLGLSPHSPAVSEPAEPADEDENTDEEDLTDGLRKLSIESHPYRFHGRSSGMLLLREVSGQLAPVTPWGQEKVQYRHHGIMSPRAMPLFDEFPPDDLLDTLVELYFRKNNDILPLLHEPLFKRNIQEGLHLRNGGFGATVLLVCANASRFTDDRRVLLDGSDDRHSAGWRWYQKVENVQKLELAPATLYELQVCCLMTQFLSGSTAPQATWNVIGYGVRRAIDVGAHRRKVYNTKPTIEDELWKRAFWVLVLHEWTQSYGLGRPASIHDEDIDVALPTPIDDEYWSLPGLGSDRMPQQPEGKPSKVAAMVSMLRLSQILAFATRTLYPTNKPKRADSTWEQRIVSELDSALNNWLDTLPSHLRWDPNREDPLHLIQSASLLGHYYQVQIAVHRPFLSVARRDSPLSFPSVIICNNAARSTVQAIEVVYRRLGTLYHGIAGFLYMCGGILMRSIWGQRRSGRTVNVDRDIGWLKKLVEMLDVIKYETHVATSGRDYMRELLAELDVPPEPQAAGSSTEGHKSAQQRSAERVTTSQSSHAATKMASMNVPDESVAGASSFATFGSTQPRQESNIPANSGGQGPQLPADFGMAESILQRTGLGSADQIGNAFPSTSGSLTQPSQLAPEAPQSLLPDFQQQFSGMSTDGSHDKGSQAELDAGLMFGLEPLGYSEAISWFPPQSNAEASGSGVQTLFPEGGTYRSQGTPDSMSDLAVLNDTLSVWTNEPMSFGWDADWGAFFNNANDRGSSSGT